MILISDLTPDELLSLERQFPGYTDRWKSKVKFIPNISLQTEQLKYEHWQRYSRKKWAELKRKQRARKAVNK